MARTLLLPKLDQCTSASKLGSHIPLSVLFTPFACYFQDHHRRIAHGNLYNGLYIIKQEPKVTPSTIFSVNSTNLKLWHPSSSVLQQIKSISVSFSSEPTPPPPSPPNLRRSSRTSKLPTKLKDFHVTIPSSSHTVNSTTKFHHSKYINYNNIKSPPHKHFINTINHAVHL